MFVSACFCASVFDCVCMCVTCMSVVCTCEHAHKCAFVCVCRVCMVCVSDLCACVRGTNKFPPKPKTLCVHIHVRMGINTVSRAKFHMAH